MCKIKYKSSDIKYWLMSYFRFTRQWNCADEARNCGYLADVLVDTGKDTIDVEIKVTKSDLWYGENKKGKHISWSHHMTNKFALCVPEELIETAKEWIKEVNPKYGLYMYQSDTCGQNIITIITPKRLHDNYNERYKEVISKRLCSALITRMGEKVHTIEEKIDE